MNENVFLEAELGAKRTGGAMDQSARRRAAMRCPLPRLHKTSDKKAAFSNKLASESMAGLG